MNRFILGLILGLTLSMIFHPSNSVASEASKPCSSPEATETAKLNDLL